MATKFFAKINAGVFFLLACIVTLISCDKADVGDEMMRSTTTKGKSYVESSKLTADDTHSTANLEVSVEYFIGEESQGKMNANADAICSANPENDNIETANMNKTFVVGAISAPASVEGSSSSNVFCDIKVNGNGEENTIKTKVTITPGMAWDRSYTLKVSKIEIDEAGVKMTEVAKKAGESGRQAILVPVKFYIDAVGTEEAKSCIVTKNVSWEQFQTAATPTIEKEEIESVSWKIADWKVKTNVHVKQTWTDGNVTYVDYPCEASYSGNNIELEDKTVKTWKASLSKIEGLTVGTPAEVACAYEYYKINQREDIYSALHETEGETKCVYFWSHPQIIFEKGNMKHTFDFISPSFSENGDDLLDATSMKSGYDLKQFRNSVTVKYGTQETGIDERVLEERQNLYKVEKAAKGIELVSKTKAYKLNAIDYTAKYYVLYTDDTKSDLMTATTSRPWNLNYLGYWSMTANGEISQSTTAISMTKSGSNDETQEIANGKWVCTTTSYNLANTTTVDGQKKDNKWEASVPTRMKLTLYGTEIDFGEDTPKAEAKDMAIALTNSTATQEDYKFTENLNFTVGDYTTVSEGYGFVTKAVEVTVKSWSWGNCWQKVEGNMTKAHAEKIYEMTDGSKKTVVRDFTYTRGSQVITYWETSEANNTESTGTAQFSILSTESKQEGDWKFNLVNTQLTFGVTCASSTQKDGWSILEANNLSVEIEGDVYTFDEMSYSASANASQSKTAETENQTEYTHSNAPTYIFGGSSMTLGTANGKIFVAKTVIPDSHNGFFPASYGKLEGDNKVACRNPKNQKDWGIGGSLKFTNGSLPYFITKDGIIEFGTFEAGSTVWMGSSPDGDGMLKNCNAKDASAAMKWMRDATINMLSYTDGTLSGFHNGNNTVVTSMFPGTIKQNDGGKWQDVSFAGVRDASGRTSWDSSF